MIKFTDYQDLVKDYKKNEKLYNKSHKLGGYNRSKSDWAESDVLFKQAQEFKETVLARKTFEILVKLNPFVRERRTNSFFHFKDIYGEDFDALEDDRMKAEIVGYLDTGASPYTLCEQVEEPNGMIRDVKEYVPCSIGYETPIWKDGKVVDYGYNCGVPCNYFGEFEPEIRVQHGRVWDAMSQEEKEEWMKNKSWKTLVDKYIK